MIQVYTQLSQGHQWLQQYQGRRPILACILGFTATALIPSISAAGATPEDRKYTAIADAEFLVNGVTPQPRYPLPPLVAGASPVLISRAVVEAFDLPVYLFNAGLPQPPAVFAIDLGGVPAKCLTTGDALPLSTVKHLFEQGLKWGHQLAEVAADGYLMISECVVGGTTTALSLLTGLGIDAAGKVNSSHPSCNHAQKWEIVHKGLQRTGLGSEEVKDNPKSKIQNPKLIDPFRLVAAVGDPMQIVAAGMAIAAAQNCGVLLAGGTQMLAVYALARALSQLDTSVLQSDADLAAQSSPTQKGIGDREQELNVSQSHGLNVSQSHGLNVSQSHGLNVSQSHGLNVSKLKVESSNLQPANLQPANLQPANLQPANLRPNNLQPANLQPANLQPANLQPANLQPNNLQPANLQPNNLQPSLQSPFSPLIWQPQRIVVGTTRWVAEDPTGDTVGLARDIGGVPLLATQLSFATSRYPQLQAYEQGYVKEGVGAGGCAIAAHLYKGWSSVQLLQAIEALVERYCPS